MLIRSLNLEEKNNEFIFKRNLEGSKIRQKVGDVSDFSSYNSPGSCDKSFKKKNMGNMIDCSQFVLVIKDVMANILDKKLVLFAKKNDIVALQNYLSALRKKKLYLKRKLKILRF